ncbi:MAG: NUDIX hydrolase [Pseudomonadota bacterium]
MKFCSSCGGPVVLRIPEGDNRERHVCTNCGMIHYINPRIIAGCLVTKGERVLLCKRAIEPRLGYWTLPAGFMENGETVEQGAARETYEEALAKVDIHGLYTVFSLPHISQVYLFFRGELIGEDYGAGPESLDVGLYEEAEVPWEDLAFPVMTRTLRYFFDDRKTGHFPTRSEAIEFRRRAS